MGNLLVLGTIVKFFGMISMRSRLQFSKFLKFAQLTIALSLGGIQIGCYGKGKTPMVAGSHEPAKPVAAVPVDDYATWTPERREKVAASAKVFCGNCHVSPKPSSFSAQHWGREVQRGFDFYFASGRADLVVPKAADIKQYFINLAPAELPQPHAVPLDVPAQQRFDFVNLPNLRTQQAVAIAGVSVIDLGHAMGPSLVMCDMRGGSVTATRLAELQSGAEATLLAQLKNPCRADSCTLEDGSPPGLLISDLGSFLPADHQAGRVVWLRPIGKDGGTYEPEVLLSGCGRVADAQAHDLDADGDLDIVVSVFGWNETGELIWLERTSPGAARADAFVRHMIDDRPGALESEVMDVNQDGNLDVVALISQEYEVVVAYLGDGHGKFEPEALFSADDPAYGSSGMVWFDLDRDGDQDCILTNGDSFDSFEVKPYHAIHWLENKGGLQFESHEIMQLPGVHEALACDLDGDKDIDIVAAAFLPRDLRSALKEEPVGIVWLENDGNQQFKARPLQVGKCSHPAICTADLNGDGRVDIAVANFYEDTAELKTPAELLLSRPSPDATR